MIDKTEKGELSCLYCGGSGEVSGTVGDMAFTFQCVCSGGIEESVRWLLGLEALPSTDKPMSKIVIIEANPNKGVESANEGIASPMSSFGNLSVFDTLEDGPATRSKDFPLALAHGKSIVIGRQEGGELEYLDFDYRPTQRMPGTQKRIVVSAFEGIDTFVSRGHFTLVGSPHGILFINGVPRRGGGIRPPVNRTILLEEAERCLGPGEEILIERGQTIKIWLPNQMRVLISAV